tara:strand:+ start:158 stop:472 length:315 start_codon:yes stop_codon:yes gene_type:complete
VKGGEVFVVEEAKEMNHEMKMVVLWIHWIELVVDEIGWVEEMESGDAGGVLEEEGTDCMEIVIVGGWRWEKRECVDKRHFLFCGVVLKRRCMNILTWIVIWIVN